MNMREKERGGDRIAKRNRGKEGGRAFNQIRNFIPLKSSKDRIDGHRRGEERGKFC